MPPVYRPPSIIDPYGRLIKEWYSQYPRLKAIQVLERLRSYGFTGGYTTVKRYTRSLRKKRKREAYHELIRLPGEEAQIDWMERRMSFGTAYGFVFVLSHSRYLWGRFYQKHTFEFFLDGHIEAMKEVGGVARTHTYDNLKTVVLARKPETVLNPQFLDFSRHYGFAIHLCTPGRANEKGRVEKVIQSIDMFLQADTFATLDELNGKFTAWRRERNRRVHRTTGKAPADMLTEERLKALPAIDYRPARFIALTGLFHGVRHLRHEPLLRSLVVQQHGRDPRRLSHDDRSDRRGQEGRPPWEVLREEPDNRASLPQGTAPRHHAPL